LGVYKEEEADISKVKNTGEDKNQQGGERGATAFSFFLHITPLTPKTKE